jgi:cardiolipin synthase A/B
MLAQQDKPGSRGSIPDLSIRAIFETMNAVDSIPARSDSLILSLAIETPTQEAIGWATLAHLLVAGPTLLSILSVKKESISAVAWCLTVILMPFAGSIFYWMFGYQSVQQPLKRKQRHARAYKARTEASGEFASTAEGLPVGDWEDLSRLAVRLGASPMIDGNRVEFFHEGQAAFASMLQAIREAKHHVHVQFFIFRSDESGRQFIEAMAERARAGVQVRLLYDAVGCWGLKSRLLRELTSAAGRAMAFLPLITPLRRFRINLRNHRKIVVVDGRIAFTGGYNIGDEYLGKHRFFGPWRDTHLRLEGPAVRWIQRVFGEDWNFAAHEEPFGAEYFPKPLPVGDVPVQIAWSGPDQQIKTIREILFAAIMKARQRVWVASPYFVPDAGLLDALCLAARSGRDVRLLLPFRPDKWLPFLAGRYYWQDALSAGVKIYQFTQGFMHAKVVLIDDCWSSVGSANFDNRSLYLNFEMNCLFQSQSVAASLEQALLRDMALSIRVNPDEFDKRTFVSRLAENTCRLLSPIL